MKQTRLFLALAILALAVMPNYGDEAALPAEVLTSDSQVAESPTVIPEPSADARCEQPEAFDPGDRLREFMAQTARVCGLCPPLNDCGGCAVDNSTCIFVDTGQRTCDLATSQQPPCGATCPPGSTLHFQQCDCVPGCGIAVTKRSLQCL